MSWVHKNNTARLCQAQSNIKSLWTKKIWHSVIFVEPQCKHSWEVEVEPRRLKVFVVFQHVDPEWNLTSLCRSEQLWRSASLSEDLLKGPVRLLVIILLVGRSLGGCRPCQIYNSCICSSQLLMFVYTTWWGTQEDPGVNLDALLCSQLHPISSASNQHCSDLLRCTHTCTHSARPWLPETHLLTLSAVAQFTASPLTQTGGNTRGQTRYITTESFFQYLLRAVRPEYRCSCSKLLLP